MDHMSLFCYVIAKAILSQAAKPPISSRHGSRCNSILILKVKNKAADSLERFVTAAGHKEQSLLLVMLPFCDVDNIVYFKRTFLTLTASPKGKQALPEGNLPAIRLPHKR